MSTETAVVRPAAPAHGQAHVHRKAMQVVMVRARVREWRVLMHTTHLRGLVHPPLSSNENLVTKARI